MEFKKASVEAPAFKRTTKNPFIEHIDGLYQAETGYIVDVENIRTAIAQLRNAANEKGYGCQTRVVTETGDSHPTLRSDSQEPGHLWIYVGDKRDKKPNGDSDKAATATQTGTQTANQGATQGAKGGSQATKTTATR